MSTSEHDVIATDEILYLSPKIIHPDPEQPRLYPDEELADSIREHGVQHAITVRPHPERPDEWMIVDGERRWRGARLAEATGVPVRIRLDLEEKADRLLIQLISNTGKPLSPLEEALAWKSILEEKGWSQAELAKALGKPRSTIGDRLRILALDDCWLALLKEGTLQISHVPFLHKFVAIPATYQAQIAAKVKTEHRLAYFYLDKGQPIPVDQLESVLRPEFMKCLRPIPTGRKGEQLDLEWPEGAEPYEGPTLEIKEEWQDVPTRYAADPDIWQPIVRRAQGKRIAAEKKARAEGTVTPGTPPHLRLPAGYKKVQGEGYNGDAPKGHTMIVDGFGRWCFGNHYSSDRGHAYDPAALLEHVEPEKLVLVERGRYDSAAVAMRDDAAYGRAREAWLKRWAARRAELVDLQRSAIASLEGPATPVNGVGARYLLQKLARQYGADLLDAAEVARLELPAIKGDVALQVKAIQKWLGTLESADMELLATTYARLVALDLDPVSRTVGEEQEHAMLAYRRMPVDWSLIGKPAAEIAEQLAAAAAAQPDPAGELWDEDDALEEEELDEDETETEEA